MKLNQPIRKGCAGITVKLISHLKRLRNRNLKGSYSLNTNSVGTCATAFILSALWSSFTRTFFFFFFCNRSSLTYWSIIFITFHKTYRSPGDHARIFFFSRLRFRRSYLKRPDIIVYFFRRYFCSWDSFGPPFFSFFLSKTLIPLLLLMFPENPSLTP